MADIIYQAPAVIPPTIKELADIASQAGIALADEQLKEYQDVISGSVSSYGRIDRLVEPALPVKYPRTPGYRPSQEENKHNAWYYKTDIKGAAEGLLKGKKVVIKDNIAIAGVPMMNGSRVLEGYVPEYDATVITRILDAGGHIIGKGVTEDFCWSGASCTTSKGTVTNPYDATRSAGGSSTGVGVLIQQKEADMGMGGDQGGSIRIPASWLGIVGLKPTWGLVPYTGICSVEPCTDFTGPMARTVKDCALLLEVTAGYDEGRDPRQERFAPKHQYSQELNGDLTGLKIGLLTEGFEGSDPDVSKIVREAAESLTACGATVSDFSMPLHNDGETIWGTQLAFGSYMHMIVNSHCMLGQKGHYPTSLIDYLAHALPARTAYFQTPLINSCLQEEYIKKRYGFHWYAKNQNLLWMLTRKYDKWLKEYDVMIMPTIKFVAPKIPKQDASVKDVLNHTLGMCANTGPFDGTGHPALSINAGFSEGLPVGMMIVGNMFDDIKVLNVAYGFEQLQESSST